MIMKSEDFIVKLKELGIPVFSISTASDILQTRAAYTRLYISRLHRTKAIRMIEHGKYCISGTDPYTVASRIIQQSYITGYAALRHYGLTTQIPFKLQVIASRYHKPIKLDNYTVEFSKVKKDFVYGYTLANNGPAFADPEKIFVDDIYLHGVQFYTEEFEYAVEDGRIDVAKLEEYAVMSGSKALIKKITKYLKKYGIDTRLSRSHVAQRRKVIFRRH